MASAVDDDMWKTGANETMWQNARYLTYNDKGGGTLKVTSVASKSAAGGSISFDSDGTIKYKPVAGWQGKDSVQYTVTDSLGGTDTGVFHVQVGTGSGTASGGSTGSGPTGGGSTTGGSSLAPVKIMAMGDSNTYGVISWYSNKEAGGYRLHLDQKLKSVGLSFDMVGSQHNGPSGFDRDHEGYNGIQTDGLTAKVPGMISGGKPDVILLMSGSNDAKTDSVAKMGSDMKQLLDTIKAHAPNAQVLVAGLPPAREGNTAGISASKVAQYNADLPGIVAAKKAAGMKVGFVDTSGLTVNDISTIQADGGVHLNSSGTEKLAGMWLNALKTLGIKDGTIDAGRSGSGGGTVIVPPVPDGPAAPDGPSGGTGNPVTAVDDDTWSVGKDQTMWQNARYLTWNDKGADGGLKVTAVASKSAAGGSITFTDDGTIKFKPLAGWQGKDAVQYTVSDADGSSDTGTFYVQVGSGGSTLPPVATPDPAPTTPSTPGGGGSGNGVDANNDHWNAKSGAQLWFNSRYLLGNDKAPDGGLAVKSIAAATAKGGSINWDAETGTTIYRSKAGYVGKDWVEYTAVDTDGSTDSALINFDVLIA